ncbi:MAG: hypothetical protein H0U57_09370 [Tatlockia sp.]|nr:hypothetical protein [Tatlockia sp.]
MYTKLFSLQELNYSAQVRNFDWLPIIEVFINYKNERPNHSSLVAKIINVHFVDLPFPNDQILHKEFKNGIQDLCHGSNLIPHETTKILQFLYFTSCFCKKEGLAEADLDHLIITLVVALNSTKIGKVIHGLLNRIDKMPDLTDYDKYHDCGLSGSYDRIPKSGWLCFCELFLPKFNGLENQLLTSEIKL